MLLRSWLVRASAMACGVLLIAAPSAGAQLVPCLPPLPCPPPLPVGSPPGATVAPYGTNDFRGFRNVLPPGENGFDNAAQIAAFEANKTYPPHSNDQLAMYSNLTTAAPGITAATIPQFYKDATFGVPSGDVESTENPEAGTTIVRDKGFGVPHIYGNTRAELMFGIGYATAEDRLFFIDALRHAGQGDLAQFAGGANVSMDELVWANEPYTQQDLVNQVNWGRSQQYGPQIFDDAQNYVDGINAYIAQAKVNPLLMPGEYDAIGQPQGPQPFTVEDIVSIATLVGGIFGNGGGQQLSNAILYQALKRRFGREHYNVAGSPELVPPARHKRGAARPKRGKSRPGSHQTPSKGTNVRSILGNGSGSAVAAGTAAPARDKASRRRRKSKARPKARVDHSGFGTFLSLVDPSDPEAPTTVRGASFPYQTLPMPSKAVLKTIALPDRYTVRYVNHVVAGAVPASDQSPQGGNQTRAAGAARPIGPALGPLANAGPGLLALPRTDSNALLVSARNSATGHPLAVMGPQVSYFTPEILMEEDIHGPGIDADGAAFPGTNLYVQLGHGRDYAWSATSAQQNIVDTFAVPLCNPSGGKVSTGSSYYLLHGRCVKMERLFRSESWKPNLADSTPAGSVTFETDRTAYGLITARARVGGRPVAYTNLRSTYMHELDSAVGFYLYNDPSAMRSPQDFFKAADRIGYTFNWFYTDNKHIAYFNSGQNPVRAPHTDPLFPSWAGDAWRGWNGAAATTPANTLERDTPPSAHPHAVDQSYFTSWNNKQAPGYNDAATGQEYASIYRSQLLDNNINHYLAIRHGKMTLADLINAMGNAGTQDLRGVEVLPYALAVIGHPRGGALGRAVSELRAWVASGSHRINRAHPGASGSYEQSDAIRILDAWWPRWVRAQFGPALGTSLLNQVERAFPINDEPGHGVSGNHLGSAFDVGFYGIVQKDLRSVLKRKVKGPLNRRYCGGGSLKKCRAALESSLLAAVGESAGQVYPADGVCHAGDQMCSDSIQFRAIGAITQPLIEWINRPTFQQADSIAGHGPG
jgi:acyl-homoserine lactone acylase PvdQ